MPSTGSSFTIGQAQQYDSHNSGTIDFMHQLFVYDPFASGSKGLVFIGDKIIVYRRDNNTELFPLKLDLPGGGPEPNETPFETFQREVKEEFNLTVSPESVVYHKRYPSRMVKNKFGHFVVVKLPDESSEDIIFGNEGKEYMLMTVDEYLNRDDAWKMFQELASEYKDTISRHKV